MTIEDIKNFLRERQGYLKKSAASLCEILEKQGYALYDDALVNCAYALEEVKREVRSKEVLENHIEEEALIDLSKYQPTKVWGKEGNWSYSYELKNEDKINERIEEIKNELKEYVDSRPEYKVESVKGSKEGLAVITDLHIGANVKSLVVNTKPYGIKDTVNYLNSVAQEINDKNYEKVHVAILGDLIESFTGTNHSATWKELDEYGYGANVLIIAYEILASFLSSIKNLEGVYIIGGNHDRITQRNDEDPESGVAKIIAYFLSKKINAKFEYSHLVLTKEINGIDYILTHGHLPLIKKNPESLVLNYGINRNNFSIILSGHLHNRSRSEQMNTATVLADAKKYRALVCPSIFTGNFYSESLGYTSSAGFLMFEAKDGKPRMTDITL